MRVKEKKKKKGMTAKELASKIGISEGALSQSIREGANPNLQTISKIADALNVPLSELFSDSQKTTFVCPNCGAKLELKKVDD